MWDTAVFPKGKSESNESRRKYQLHRPALRVLRPCARVAGALAGERGEVRAQRLYCSGRGRGARRLHELPVKRPAELVHRVRPHRRAAVSRKRRTSRRWRARPVVGAQRGV